MKTKIKDFLFVQGVLFSSFRRRSAENFMFWLARKLPKKVQYYSYINTVAIATTGDNGHLSPPEILAMDVPDLVFGKGYTAIR